MPTEIIQVDAVIAPDDWTLGAGASKVAAVQSPDDDDTSYINSGTSAGTQQWFTMANPAAIGAGDAINSVSITARCKRGGATSANYRAGCNVSGGTQADGVNRTAGASYADTTETFALNPDAGAWTFSDLEGLRIGIAILQTRDVRCTSFYVTIDYTPAGQPARKRWGGVQHAAAGQRGVW